MTSDVRRFPVGLTLATAIAFATLIGLGVWQLQRLEWKHRELARIARLQAAGVQPIGPVLARAARGEDVSFTRVIAHCAAGAPATTQFRMTTDNGQWISRAIAPCHLTGLPYDGVLVDRGFLESSRGETTPTIAPLPAPQTVIGALFAKPASPGDGLRRPAPYIISMERETPPAPGVTPAPYAVNASDNLQYVGSYAPTWFGLAGVLVCFYAAMLWRRFHPKP